MNNSILILKEKSIAIELDSKKKLIYFYHSTDKEIELSSKSILLTTDSETTNEINKHFSVDIKEYGVAVDDGAPRTISKEDEKEIYKERFVKYLMVAFIFILLFMINAEDVPTKGANSLGYIALFGVFLLYILILGKEMTIKDKFTTMYKHNIKTKPLPTKEEQFEILEAKIDKLLDEKKDDE